MALKRCPKVHKREESIDILYGGYEMLMWHKKSGQSKKLSKKREEWVRVECMGKSKEERTEMTQACRKNREGKIG